MKRLSKYFTWQEALWLPRWSIVAEPTREQIENIRDLAHRLDFVREYLGVPLLVTSWLRPLVPSRGDYNAAIGGAPASYHRVGSAADLAPKGMSVDDAMEAIGERGLALLGLRAEDNGESKGRPWLHFDTGKVHNERIFKP